MEKFCGFSLIAVALIQRAFDQVDLVTFDFVVEVYTSTLEGMALIVIELSLQRFDLTREGLCERDELIDVFRVVALHVSI